MRVNVCISFLLTMLLILLRFLFFVFSSFFSSSSPCICTAVRCAALFCSDLLYTALRMLCSALRCSTLLYSTLPSMRMHRLCSAYALACVCTALPAMHWQVVAKFKDQDTKFQAIATQILEADEKKNPQSLTRKVPVVFLFSVWLASLFVLLRDRKFERRQMQERARVETAHLQQQQQQPPQHPSAARAVGVPLTRAQRQGPAWRRRRTRRRKRRRQLCNDWP